jgi:hypothetical protein
MTSKSKPPEPEPTDEKMYTSEPLEDEHGDAYVIRQQNVGPGREAGGGEWPDPHTPPSATPRGETASDEERLDEVDEAGIESFPASDPPASNLGRG